MPTRLPTYKPPRLPSDRPPRALRSSAADGYGYRWQKLRAWYLREHPLCVHCEAAGRTTAATEVDHVLPKLDGGSDATDNLQALCIGCHSRKTAIDVARRYNSKVGRKGEGGEIVQQASR